MGYSYPSSVPGFQSVHFHRRMGEKSHNFKVRETKNYQRKERASKQSRKMEEAMKNLEHVMMEKAVRVLSERYNFSLEEGLRVLKGEEGVQEELKMMSPPLASECGEKEKKKKLRYPYKKMLLGCNALQENNRLFTQCEGKVKEGREYCNGCLDRMRKSGSSIPKHGTVTMRESQDKLRYVSPQGVKQMSYVKYLEREGYTREYVESEARKEGREIDECYFEEEKEEKKERKLKESKVPRYEEGEEKLKKYVEEATMSEIASSCLALESHDMEEDEKLLLSMGEAVSEVLEVAMSAMEEVPATVEVESPVPVAVEVELPVKKKRSKKELPPKVLEELSKKGDMYKEMESLKRKSEGEEKKSKKLKAIYPFKDAEMLSSEQESSMGEEEELESSTKESPKEPMVEEKVISRRKLVAKKVPRETYDVMSSGKTPQMSKVVKVLVDGKEFYKSEETNVAYVNVGGKYVEVGEYVNGSIRPLQNELSEDLYE